MAQSIYSLPSITSSLIGQKAIKYTIDVNTNYNVVRSEKGFPYIYNFTKFNLDEKSQINSKGISSFNKFKTFFSDYKNNIHFSRGFFCKLKSSQDQDQDEKDNTKRWEGYISEKGLRKDQIEPLTLFIFNQNNNNDNEYTIHHLNLNKEIRVKLCELMRNSRFSRDSKEKSIKTNLKIDLPFNDDDDFNDINDISVDINFKIPILYKPEKNENSVLLINTLSQHQGGFPGFQYQDSSNWSGRLSWFEVQDSTIPVESSQVNKEESFDSDKI
ncbi:uncharacterized protein I206_105050 [Kwoniella pini CBS 10737]|uniref:Uncharacterized protein n=1 Tax=Kwoniella pini CBS 10737 TaxID=1296096 RepID=A0A1B9I8N4_9TREE|nr:uncharacterized protein I206_02590 [Kwoniella pini CBS 10737]OCF51874.1 hypothetical protein I206_02590 [Kwoniella pini CBS 10737]